MAIAGSLQYTLEVVDKNFRASIDKANKSIKSLGASFDNANAKQARFGNGLNAIQRNSGKITLAIGAIATSVGFAAKKFTDAAGDAAETQNKFEAVFGGLKGDAEDFANTLADTVGRVPSEIKDGLASFQGLTVGLGFAKDEAADMAYQLQALALDFASFNNLADDDAIGRFISGMSGSGEVLDRFGVNIKQTNLDLKLLELGFKKSTQGASEAEKAQARLAIITETLTEQGAVGDAAKTADSYANRMKRLRSESIKLQQTIGVALIPVFQKLISASLSAISVISRFATFLQENEQAMKLFKVGLIAISVVMGGVLVAALYAATTAFISFAAVTAPITLTLAAIGLAIGAFIVYWDDLAEAISIGAGWIVDKFTLIGDVFKGLWVIIQENLGSIVTFLSVVFFGPIGLMLDKFVFKNQEVMDTIVNLFKTGWSSILEFGGEVVTKFFDLGASIAKALVSGVKSAISGLKSAVVDPIASAYSAAKAKIAQLASLGRRGGRASGGMIPGFAKGGFTEGGAAQVAGVVHGGEWVAPKWMVNSMKSTFNNLDNIRKGGSGTSTTNNNYTINNNQATGDLWSDMAYMKFATKYA